MDSNRDIGSQEPPSVSESSLASGIVSKPFQFRLSTVFWVTGSCALLFAVVRAVGPENLGTFAGGVFLIVALAMLFAGAVAIVFPFAFFFVRVFISLSLSASVGAQRLADFVKRNRRAVGISLSIALTAGGLLAITLPPPSQGEPHPRMHAASNLRQLAMALVMYASEKGTYPPAYIADENGKPMHSWRVLILPYIGQQDLYDAYDFSEPWNGPNNRQLHDEVVELYQFQNRYASDEERATAYVAIVGAETMWPGEVPVELTNRPFESLGRTIQLVEVENSGIHWMEPRDLRMETLQECLDSPVNFQWEVRQPAGAQQSGEDLDGDYAWVAWVDGTVEAIAPNDLPGLVSRCRLPGLVEEGVSADCGVIATEAADGATN